MYVEPIRDIKQLYLLEKALYDDKKYRELFLVQFLYNSNLRVGDALKIKWKHIIDRNYEVPERLYLSEQKTKKNKLIQIPDSLKKAIIMTYKRVKEPYLNEYVFLSLSNRVKQFKKPWTRVYVTRFLKQYAREIGIKENIGAHSLRKSWAYHSYKSGTDIYLIQRILNHSTTRITEIYAGITQDKIVNEYKKVSKLNSACDEFFE